VTDQEILEEIQRALIEPPDLGTTWPSGLWTTAEVVGYLNQRQDRFLKETLLITSWLDTPVVAGQSQQDLPDGWLATRNAFLTDGSRTYPLSPLTRREADSLLPGWATDFDTPLGYLDEEWATRQTALVPAPLVAMVMHLYAALVGNPVDGSGIALTVPDECAPYLFYGVLADMFGKQGRAYDAARAAYCEQRFAEGVALSQALLKSVVIS
jgi:hypothetical protein